VNGVLLGLGVLALGGCGALLRTAGGAAIDRRGRTSFPLGTFVVNLSGSFLAGLLYGAAVAGDAALLVSTGLIGAYTTFSTWMGDSEKLVRAEQVQMAMFNLLGSILLGLGAALLGKVAGEGLF
jgi:fluoride exporter